MIRRGVDMAMRMMGEQFVTGETIDEALATAAKWKRAALRYSYDMLGEAAMTAADATDTLRLRDCHLTRSARPQRAVASTKGPGISIKLSALHPRYSAPRMHRVMDELLPRSKTLALLAKHYDIGLNIDAEEADRLEISLDILEALACDPDLSGWNGIGFVIQAYGKRCPFVIDWHDRPCAPRKRPHHGAAGQGCLLGHGDQARAGRRARGLSGLHPQGAH